MSCNPFAPELNRPGFQLLPVYISGSIKLFVIAGQNSVLLFNQESDTLVAAAMFVAAALYFISV